MGDNSRPDGSDVNYEAGVVFANYNVACLIHQYVSINAFHTC